ncbi:MAG: hypothetical protein DMF78_25555 [Acidobacteria bacterium]|nr:MAG: hypothetical protein DMF78_25555 [Acidobacteriota bacterium]
MKLIAAGVVLFLAASTAAEAFPFFHRARSTDKLPKPIDSPIVRPKLREDHKLGKKSGVHRASVTRYEWGRQKNLRYVSRPHPFGHNFYDVF